MELSMDPPCCKMKCCQIVFEENPCCKSIGKIGLPFFDRNRGTIMLCAAVLSLISLVLAIIPVVSTSLSTTDVKNTAWTKGESDSGDFTMWIGLNKVVYESNFVNGDFRWDSSECNGFESQDANNFCDDCKSSCLAAVTMVITNLVTTFPQIKGNIARSTIKGDRNCEKTMGLITGFISTLSTLLALSLYADVCGRQLPNTVGGMDINYELGPGFICLLVATLLKPIDVVIHLLTPVPDSTSTSTDEGAAGDIQKSLL